MGPYPDRMGHSLLTCADLRPDRKTDATRHPTLAQRVTSVLGPVRVAW